MRSIFRGVLLSLILSFLFHGICFSADHGTWSWINRSPTGDTITDIWAVSSDNFFFTTEHNELFHHFEGKWHRYEIENAKCEGIWGLSDQDVIACGSNGKVFRFDGTQWTMEQTGASGMLNDIYGFAANDIYAVSGDGELVHWDGSQWTITEFPESPDLYCVWGLTPDKLFVGGAYGVIYVWDGASWKKQDIPVTDWIGGFAGVSEDAIYAAGSNSAILKYDGNHWTIESQGTCHGFVDICALAADDIYVSGLHGVEPIVEIFHFDGSTWSWIEINTIQNCMINRCLCSTGENSILAGCWSTQLLHIEGDQATSFFSGPQLAVRGACGVSDENLILACSDELGQKGAVYRWDGTQLTDISPPSGSERLYNVWSYDNETFYFIGRDQWVMKDNVYVPIMEDVTTGAYGICGFSNDDVFVCGRSGLLMHYDGESWSKMEKPYIPFSNFLWAIWGTDSENVYAVGDGCIIHWDGTTWTVVHESNDVFSSISGTGQDDIYAVAYNDLILHWDGTQWAPILTGFDLQYSVVKCFGSTVIVSGHNPNKHESYLLTRQGKAEWEISPANQSWYVYDLWTADNDSIYCLGDLGSIHLWDMPGDPPPTPTPTAVSLGIDLEISQEVFRFGDEFLVTAVYSNPGPESYLNTPLAVLLEIEGLYFWYPDWSRDFNVDSVDLTVGVQDLEILRFVWPDISGSYDGVIIYGAMLTSDLSTLFGSMDTVTFGWE